MKRLIVLFLILANSSDSNAVELGDRTWHLPGTPFSKRRAMIEEAQEVRASCCHAAFAMRCMR